MIKPDAKNSDSFFNNMISRMKMVSRVGRELALFKLDPVFFYCLDFLVRRFFFGDLLFLPRLNWNFFQGSATVSGLALYYH